MVLIKKDGFSPTLALDSEESPTNTRGALISTAHLQHSEDHLGFKVNTKQNKTFW